LKRDKDNRSVAKTYGGGFVMGLGGGSFPRLRKGLA